jgi:transcriptional regulator with XRE-family HTH domain
MDLQQRAFLREVGDRLRRLREGQRLTQAQLAQRCGVHRTFVGSVERGERNVSVLNLRAIAQALRVPLVELLAAPPAEGQT